MRRLRLGAAGLAVLLTACPQSCLIQRAAPLNSAPGSTASDVVRPSLPPAPVVSVAAPVTQHPGKGIFGDSIEFVGYDTDPPRPRAGRPVAITFYFHALKNVGHDWQIFVHADDRGGRLGRINGDHYPASGQLHTDRWQTGQYIADRFSIDLPEGLSKEQLDLWAGFYQDDARLPITNPKECPNDGNNRLLAGTLNIE
jgi:hypothetical protein